MLFFFPIQHRKWGIFLININALQLLDTHLTNTKMCWILAKNIKTKVDKKIDHDVLNNENIVDKF